MKKFALSIALTVVAAIAASSNDLGPAKAASSGVACGSGLTAGIVHSSVTAPIPVQASYNFTAACVQHDTCYATFGPSKLTCDKAFLADMDATCKHTYPPAGAISIRNRCENVALLYHADFEDGGELQYQKAQKAAVIALFNGRYTGTGTLKVELVFPPDPDGSQSPPYKSSTPIPSITVTNGVLDTFPVVITSANPALRKATATASGSVTENGLTFAETNKFSYDGLGGVSTTVVTTYSGLMPGSANSGATTTISGGFSGRKQVGP